MGEPADEATNKSGDLLKFLYSLPPISERQLAIVKLVARYAAADDQFAQTRAKEFDFTNPGGGSLYSLFNSYVEQYKLVLSGVQPPEGNILERAVRRAAEADVPGAQKSPTITSSPEPIIKPSAFTTINWQDFVVLETVEFFSADLKGTSRLSAPLSRAEAALRKEQTSRKRRAQRDGTLEPTYKSPYTGELVPASQFDEHMRVHSLDPTWKKQHDVAAERQASTNLDARGAAANLARLQEKRRRMLEE